MTTFDWGTIAAALTALAALAALGRVIFKLARGIGHFLDDWNGEAPRPGQPHRPGVLEQLAGVVEEQARVSHELQTNGGSSLKDAVKRVEAAQAEASRLRNEDRAVMNTLTGLLGGFIGREQQARIEGRKADGQLWSAVEAINQNDPHPDRTTEKD
jgi:hypothetical protein